MLHPDFLLDQLTLSQLQEWEAYDRLDPVGTWREDFRMAFLATMMNNLTLSVHGKKGAKQSGIEEFMPNWDITAPKAEKVQSVEDMRKVFEEIVASQKKKPGIQPKPPRLKEEQNG